MQKLQRYYFTFYTWQSPEPRNPQQNKIGPRQVFTWKLGWFSARPYIKRQYKNWQGCIWSPLLFNIVIDWVLKTALDKLMVGFTLEDRYDKKSIVSNEPVGQSQRLKEKNSESAFKVPDLEFADDIGLLESTKRTLQHSNNRIVETAKSTAC